MIARFSVRNYRSIRDKVTIELIADQQLYKGSPDPLDVGTSIPEFGVRILPAIALFGQNGAGKSNILRGLNDMLYLMLFGTLRRPTSSPGDLGPLITPFLLESETRNSGTELAIDLLLGKTLFSYALQIRNHEISQERLFIQTPSDRAPSRFFERTTVGNETSWQWSKPEEFGLREEQRGLSNDLQSKQVFLPLLQKAFKIESIRPIYQFLADTPFPCLGELQSAILETAVDDLQRNPTMLKAVREFLNLLDLPINRITSKRQKLVFFHLTDDKQEVPFEFADESGGTQQLLKLSVSIIESLRDGTPFIIDELDAHLHPMLSHRIIDLYQTPSINKKNAQLLFSTHDTTIMDQNLLRRDQIYIANRSLRGATSVKPLTDLSVRRDLVLDKAYLEGRLSGLPILGSREEFHEAIRAILARSADDSIATDAK